MSCQIKNGKYYAPSGVESQLYKDLSEIVGEAKAKDLFVFAYSDAFPQKFSPIEKAGEYKSGTTTISFGDYTNPINNRKSGEIELKLIQTPQKDRGKGRARTTIKEFLNYTDALGKDVVLTVSPRDKDTTEKGLIEFYKSVGFVQSPTGFEMIRYRRSSIFDKNGEPKAKKVIELARQQNENTTPLSPAEKIEVGMLMAQFPNMETSDDLLIELEKAFYKDGLFNPTQQTLTRTLYSQYEAENLLSNVRLLASVKDGIERLKNTPELIENATILEAEYRTDELNIFGKFKLLNPYILKQDTIEEFGGLENINMSDVRDKSITEEELKQFKRIPVIDDNGSPVLNKRVYENATKLVEDFNNLTEEKLLDYGINVEGLDEQAVIRFIENPSVENTMALNENSPQREKVIKIEKQDRDLVFLETLKTEEQLFNELSLIQTETPNVYHRIERVDEQQLREFLGAETTTAEYQLYKDYYGYITPSFTPSFTPSPIGTDIDYLKGEFVADFNAEILKNPTHEFYNKFEVNEKGISLKYDDPISISQIQAYIAENVKLGKELADYSAISKLMPNFKEETVEDLRLIAINNKNSLKVPTTQVTRIDNNTIIAKNETADFVNFNNEVYELTNKEKSDSVYKKLNLMEDLNYYQTEVEIEEYVDQVKVTQSNLEDYNSIKKLYKNAELEDNFDCV